MGSAARAPLAHLHHGDQAVVAVGVGLNGEAAGGVAAADSVRGVPGRRVRLVLVGHGQVGYDDIHPVLGDFAIELPGRKAQ